MQGKGYDDLEHTTITYNSLINALSVSSVPDKASLALNTLLEMKKLSEAGKANVAPNLKTFGAVLKACSYSQGNTRMKRKAFDVALQTVELLRNDSELEPDPFIYDPLFSTIGTTLKGREYIKVMEGVFHRCCEDGALNDVILRNLRRHAPSDVFQKLVGSTAGGVSVKDLPKEWSRNADNRER